MAVQEAWDKQVPFQVQGLHTWLRWDRNLAHGLDNAVFDQHMDWTDKKAWWMECDPIGIQALHL
jgi:hypothetical protein